MTHIIDANNHFRLRMETNFTGNPLRDIFSEISTMNPPVFVAWDGMYGNSSRRKLFPDYKKHRRPPDKDLYVNFDMIYEILKHTQAIQISVPNYEGDDVVAKVARHFVSNNMPVTILSTDRDFIQLQGESPSLVSLSCKPIEGLDPSYIRYYKTVVGDASDNIKGIPGFGKKSWEQADKKQLKSWIDAIVSRSTLPEIELPPRCLNWVQEENNLDLLRTYWTIVGFLDVPDDAVNQHTHVGSYNPQAAEEYLKEFML